MSWVTSKVEEEREARAAVPLPQRPYTPPPPAWLSVLEAITTATQASIREFNQAQGSQQFDLRVHDEVKKWLEIFPIPGSNRIATLTLYVENDLSGDLFLTCPPEGEGIGRRGKFRIRAFQIEALPDFVGTPQPPSSPMSAAEFVRFILEPFLFHTK
jgi:hypothetical protein